MDHLGSVSSSYGICGNISEMATFKLTYFLIKRINLVKNNLENSLSGVTLIS
jgi:hypothetical protein